MTKEAFISCIKGGLIVSCQALPGEPLYRPEGGIMPLMARAAAEAGAKGIRCNGIQDITGIKKTVNLPVIGIIKKNYEGFGAYITPSMDEVDQLVAIGCEVIAIDCTSLSRPGNLTASEYIRAIKKKYPHQLLMADCASFEDAYNAAAAGVDFVGTTMNGYVGDNSATILDGPNYQLARKITASIAVPLIAEGRIHRPEDAAEMLRLGALAVVVGGAITRPKEIAERFVHAINASAESRN